MSERTVAIFTAFCIVFAMSIAAQLIRGCQTIDCVTHGGNMPGLTCEKP